MPRLQSFVSLLAIGAALSGCTVGPDYKGPPDIVPEARLAQSFHRADTAQAESGPPPATWWLALNDPELDRLVTLAFSNNPDLHAAEARLREARAGLRQQQQNELPTVSSSALYLHTQEPALLGGRGGSSDLNFYDVGFDATWELDLFGGTRRAIESAGAQADASRADLEDLHVSLAAEIAQTYVGLRDEQQQQRLSRQSAELESRILALTVQRRQRGTASDADVERLQTQLETTQGTLIPLKARVEESLDRLAILTGREPGALDADLSATGSLPTLPAVVAVGDPAAMLRRRPDIRKAERTLAASNAQIGQHVADLFPKVNLLGNIGWGSTDIGNLFDSRNFAPLAAPVLQWNILDFGRTRAKISHAEAGRDEAASSYEAAVLAALQDAETALSRYGHQREDVVNLEKVDASASRTAELIRTRYKAGTASLIDLLDAERTRVSADEDLESGRAQLVTDYTSLQKSLGLGWQQPAKQTMPAN